MRLYNTLSRKIESFKPLHGKKMNLFVCGPTVYDFSHLGHARTYIVFDMIVRYLRRGGYKVFYLQNITDIEDRIIQRAKELGKKPKDIARKFEKEYLKDVGALGITSVNKYARATDHIKEIVSQVDRLLKKGYAYKTSDGIYYDISKFSDYGKLSRRTKQQAEDAVSRIDESAQKRNKGDFALWKFSKPGEPKWPFDSSLRSSLRVKEGRPGWHIEDTAITEKYFGPQYDLHGGARDLIFPHHEAEIAQIEAISGEKPVVRYWLHTGFLTVRGEKMAKSLGNFVTIRDFLKNHPPRVLRLLILKSHYRSPIDYSEKAIVQTEKELERIDEFIDKCKMQNAKCKMTNQNAKLIKYLLQNTKTNFKLAMEDDFNTPKAIAVIFTLVNQGNALLAQNKLGKKEAREILGFTREADTIFQFILRGKKKNGPIPGKVLELATKREKYRKQKNWQMADDIRRKIGNLGYHIEDTKKGPRIKKG